MQRLADMGMSVNQFIVAIMLVLVGFSTYYVIPMAFLKQEEILLFVLLNLLLILIIIGLTFICVLVFRYVEAALLWLTLHTCCCRDRHVYTIIVKNMDGHRPRNSKTSIMFTLAISFLIFSASSFTLISTLIAKTAESLIGADLSATGYFGASLLDEIPIQQFLEGQMAEEGQPVFGYAFGTVPSSFWLSNGGDGKPYILDNSRYAHYPISVYGVPANYLNVTDVEFYVPTDIQEGLDGNETSSGYEDAVGLLYSPKDVSTYPTYTGPGTPTDRGDSIDYYNVSVTNHDSLDGFAETIKVILPSGARHAMNAAAGEVIRLSTGTNSGGDTYRAVVRAYAKKFPGFLFSDFQEILLRPQALVSIPQYRQMMLDHFYDNPDAE